MSAIAGQTAIPNWLKFLEAKKLEFFFQNTIFFIIHFFKIRFFYFTGNRRQTLQLGLHFTQNFFVITRLVLSRVLCIHSIRSWVYR